MIRLYYTIKKKRRIILLLALLSIAAYLHLYQLESRTEFLGDQGRTGIIIWNAWQNKTIPLLGPPVLTGQHLGPFFYYFIATPFIISGFNPVAPALWMALFGILSVYLLFYLGEKLFGFWISLGVSMLYASSPFIISSDRTLWEPNIIPFFILLYIFCIYFIYQRRLFAAFLPLGIIVGILVQLHYPAVFFIPLNFLFLLFLLVTKKEKESTVRILFWSLAGGVGFLAILSPFLFYESQHAWRDIKELFFSVLPSGTGFGKRAFLHSFLDYSSRLFFTMLPTGKSQIMVLMWLGIFLAIFLKIHFWGIFFFFWFITGVTGISLYKGIVFDHYLNFILPVPFFLFGLSLHFYKKYIPSLFLVTIIAFGVILQLRTLSMRSEKSNDIARVRAMVSEMEALSGGKAFSFTLLSSRSFSDLHYRYFFLIHGIKPQPITSPSYARLFIVCGKAPCPSMREMKRVRSIKAICYDEYCGDYQSPTVNLDAWAYVGKYDAFGGRLFFYTRKSLLDASFPVQ